MRGKKLPIMTLGRLLYKCLFKPTLFIRYNLAHFGIIGWMRIYTGERAMKKAAMNLPPITLSNVYLLECSFLTGEKYWHQTIFCAYTLAASLEGKLKVNIYSDGTLSKTHIQAIKRVLANVCIVQSQDIEQEIRNVLPEKEFPLLRSLRKKNPFFRKLIDMRLNQRYIVQLDSDMLFFKRPDILIDGYLNDKAYFMQDTLAASYYVLPELEIEEKLNIKLNQKINSGILAYNSAKIDWYFVERVCGFLLTEVTVIHPPMFEQTINAILISTLSGQPLPDDYHILYDSNHTALNKEDAVRHYIYKAKLLYFSSEWRKKIP